MCIRDSVRPYKVLCRPSKALKFSEVILIPKLGKGLTKFVSYRPVRLLLPSISKLLEQLILQSTSPVLNDTTPNHHFVFRQKRSTIQQCNRIARVSNKATDQKKYSAAFLDVCQAFNKIWHDALLYNIKQNHPTQYYLRLKSYLLDCHLKKKVKKFLISTLLNLETLKKFPGAHLTIDIHICPSIMLLYYNRYTCRRHSNADYSYDPE